MMPTKTEIQSQNDYLLKRQQNFRNAAERIARSLAHFSEVEKVALIGSVAVPLKMEIPRFREYRKAGIKVFHECKDVDLAVWISELSRLKNLQRAKTIALQELYEQERIGVASHEVELFLFAPDTDRYLGRICKFASCPKQRKLECLVPDCGKTYLLQQHLDFEFDADALSAERSILLFNRAR